MTGQVHRRELAFDDLDAVMRDVEQLAASGYERAGNWDLAQVCGHLADWMRYPVEGYPKAPLPMRAMLWAVRISIGKRELRKILENGSMSAGNPTFRDTIPSPGGDEAAAVEQLRQVVTRFKTHEGKFHPSPVFGQLDRDAMTRLQLVHCAHHLSFLVKKG